jgi:DNA mismatch repair protein MutS
VPAGVTHPALERLRDINPDDLRPRDALDLLYELRELAQQDRDALNPTATRG